MAKVPIQKQSEGIVLSQGVAKPIRLVNVESFEPKYVTTFVATGAPGELVLTMAAIAPPAVFTQEEMDRVKYIDAFVVGRFVLTDRHLEELIDVLTSTFNGRTGAQVYRKEKQAE